MNSNQSPTSYGDILVVDDTPDNLRVLSTMLAGQGYQVRKAINGDLALRAAQNAPPDLILLDILMPKMDGYEVCSLLKSNSKTSEIPVIFISALDDIFDQVKAFEAGGVDYITKPFQESLVLVRVKNQLAIRHLYRQLQQQANQLAEQNALLRQEIKERQRAEAETNLLLKTIQAINQAQDLHSALEVTLYEVCQTIHWDLGEAWVPNPDETVLEYSRRKFIRDPKLEPFGYSIEQLKIAPNVGLPGRVWVSKQLEWIENVTTESHQVFLRSEAAVEVGLKAALGVPILLEEQVLAVLLLFKQESLKPQPRLIELVSAVATQLGSFIQRKKAEAALIEANVELQRIATLDELTGVANRRRFNEFLNKEWRRMAREQRPLSLILCDLDHFKYYNDAYGHLAGDFCLQQVAQAIAKTFNRPADLVARYGGEEFAVILPNTPAEGALKIGEAMRNEVEHLKIVHASSAAYEYITLSVGVASLIPHNQLDPSTLIAASDKALYEAKEGGRNCSVLKTLEQLPLE